ncbi:MAG: hypothetical protein U9R08_01040 [Nanoarchaeota archaeon]|nr:hypothetical protein [Nanoarchaeota archaeon]
MKEKNLFQYNKDNFHNEIYNRLITHLSTLPNKRFTEVSEKINVQNGFFDLETRTLIPHSKDIFTVNQLNLAYYPEETEMPIFQKYLDVIEQDSDGLSQMLQELAGYVLQEGNARQVVHFLYGATGDNGKSVF